MGLPFICDPIIIQCEKSNPSTRGVLQKCTETLADPAKRPSVLVDDKKPGFSTIRHDFSHLTKNPASIRHIPLVGRVITTIPLPCSMQILTVTIAVIFILVFGPAFSRSGYDPHYRLLHSGNLVADKNFYLLTVVDQSPEIIAILRADDSLASFQQARVGLIQAHGSDTCRSAASLLTGFRYSTLNSFLVDAALRRDYARSPITFERLVRGHLLRSGYYQRFATLGNLDLLLDAWSQVVIRQ